MVSRDFNPRPPCGGRPKAGSSKWSEYTISIHAPRAGGDFVLVIAVYPSILISIHAPRAGGDRSYQVPPSLAALFQSTPPVRGATA